MSWFKHIFLKIPYTFEEYIKKLCKNTGYSIYDIRHWGFRVECNLVDNNFEKDAILFDFRIRKDPFNNDMWDVNWDESPPIVNCSSYMVIVNSVSNSAQTKD